MHEVSIVKHPAAAVAVEQALNLLGGIACIVQPGERVLIKPNGLFQTYRPGMVTSPAVIAALAKLVLAAGASPVVGENNLAYDPSSPRFATSCGKYFYEGLVAAGIADDVQLVDLMLGEMVEVDFPRGRAIHHSRMSRTVLSFDKIIDVPVLKTHDHSGVLLTWDGRTW